MGVAVGVVCGYGCRCGFGSMVGLLSLSSYRHSASTPSDQFLTSLSVSVAPETIHPSVSAQQLATYEPSSQSDLYTLELPSLVADVDRGRSHDPVWSFMCSWCCNFPSTAAFIDNAISMLNELYSVSDLLSFVLVVWGSGFAVLISLGLLVGSKGM